MTLSVWRYAHLALAVFSSLFLVVASATGIILAADAAGQKIPPYAVGNFKEITLDKVLPVLQDNYLEVTEISVDHNHFVTLQGLDMEGNDVSAYIDPNTGKTIGIPPKKSDFIQWVTSLHRSLFLHEAGRLFVGVNAFLLAIIALTGVALVVKRQKGFRRFFSKIVKDSFAQYYHVVLGKLMLIPILIIAVSGTYLSMQRFKLFPEKPQQHKEIVTTDEIPEAQNIAHFNIFKATHLADVQKIEFPFDTEDPQEVFTLKLNDKELKISQFTGEILSEVQYPSALIMENLSLDLHTGRGSIVWAIVLGIACINILFFIYSGFAMTLHRKATRLKNKYTAQEAHIILLVGTENGSTLGFANAIHGQLLANGQKSYIAALNQYCYYPAAEYIIILTSTHGLGDAPAGASKFMALTDSVTQNQGVQVSVVGFGSKSYPDFCGYAVKVHNKLAGQPWTSMLLDVHAVDDKSPVQFTEWVKNWSAASGITLSATPALYAQKPKKLQSFRVIDKTQISETDHTFSVTLKPRRKTKFTSGDLLAIYPTGDGRERLYSIGKCNGNIQLVVKLHQNGFGSGFLYALEKGIVIKARLTHNKAFHLPKRAKTVALIANGTGIAPFLGMVEENKRKAELHLYCGFRTETESITQYRQFANVQIDKGHLKAFDIAFSREQNHCYVMDLIKREAAFFAGLLNDDGVIMICGSLAMQQDVEKVLNTICNQINKATLSQYKSNNQVFTDCY